MESELIQCPGCDLQLPADDYENQIAHMQANHPEIIEQTLTEAGFKRDPNTNEWIDTLSEII